MRAIVTVSSKDAVGIIAKVSTCLADNNVNISDISQRVMNGFFTMMMLVELDGSKVPFAELSDKLQTLAKENGLDIRIQREDIFNSMYRI